MLHFLRTLNATPMLGIPEYVGVNWGCCDMVLVFSRGVFLPVVMIKRRKGNLECRKSKPRVKRHIGQNIAAKGSVKFSETSAIERAST